VTPALLVLMPQLEHNEAAMRSLVRGRGANLRPHAKAHKSGGFTRWLLEQSNGEITGMCTQTVGETEAIVSLGGCKDVLLTNEVATDTAAARLASLAAAHPAATVGVLVDHRLQVEMLARAAATAKAKLRVLVEVDAGQDRCGVRADSPEVLSLVRAIEAEPVLDWGGLHVYHGGIQHVRAPSDRLAAVTAGPAEAARTALRSLSEHKLKPQVVTGGGTGTLMEDLQVGTHNELQPGSYLFMDGDYARNEDLRADGRFFQSLFLHATVISLDESAGKRVLDAGSKACDLVCGPPLATSIDDPALAEALRDVTYASGGDEHGVLRGVPPGVLPLGSTVQLVPSHCDPTVNLYDYMVGVRNGLVEHVWTIDARGY